MRPESSLKAPSGLWLSLLWPLIFVFGVSVSLDRFLLNMQEWGRTNIAHSLALFLSLSLQQSIGYRGYKHSSLLQPITFLKENKTEQNELLTPEIVKLPVIKQLHKLWNVICSFVLLFSLRLSRQSGRDLPLYANQFFFHPGLPPSSAKTLLVALTISSSPLGQ